MNTASKRATAVTVTLSMDALAGVPMSKSMQELTMQTHITTAPVAATVLCHREEAANYDRVVLRLNDDVRLIECKDAIQWIVQHRAGQRLGGARWSNVRYHRTRSTLSIACQRSGIILNADQLAVVASLPTICGGA